MRSSFKLNFAHAVDALHSIFCAAEYDLTMPHRALNLPTLQGFQLGHTVRLISRRCGDRQPFSVVLGIQSPRKDGYNILDIAVLRGA